MIAERAHFSSAAAAQPLKYESKEQRGCITQRQKASGMPIASLNNDAPFLNTLQLESKETYVIQARTIRKDIAAEFRQRATGVG
jgi:hypothetical protein